MKRACRFAAALLAVLPPVLQAQDYLPPDELIGPALLARPEVRAAAARVDAAGAGARALGAGSNEFEALLIPQRRNTDHEGDFNEWEAQLSRRIRLPGKARLDREIGGHLSTGADLRLDDAEHQAARRLLVLWMDWLRTGRTWAELDRQQQLLQRERDALARRLALGDVAQRQLDLFEAELARLQAQAIVAEAAAAAARQALAGEFPQLPVPARLPALPEPQPLPGGSEAWRQLIVERSHEIGIAREDALRQRAQADRARADRRPDPSLGLRVMDERGGMERSIGLVLSVPIGSRYRSAVADGEAANATAAEVEADGVRRMVEQEAWMTTRAADAALAQWQAQQRALQAQEAASARARRAWELGESDLGEYLLSQRNQRQAALDEATARIGALEAGLRVRVDSHELWHPDLPLDGHDHDHGDLR
ncbi:transporter [Pseudoxanthomonas kalamensis DSM 18571]|uniref:TolC family protein n=1 Tax=Pseudoxanthomonas kalamensis TaxID=289483 RepID=UPI001391CDCB|nr:TolC family protein [Pseudoxanthomonas kalamensis]KAF1712223.1 transporter [Pseudoxanthomonas kalamensis DSM 18571]